MGFEIYDGRFETYGWHIEQWYKRVEAVREYCAYPTAAEEHGFTRDGLADAEEQIVADREGREKPAPNAASGADEETIYLGEVLLSIAGGRWAWGDREPVVVPDEVLGLPAIAPHRLINYAVQTGSGHEFASVAASWQQQAATYRASHQGWEPVRYGMADAGNNPRLNEWLERRRADFPAWAEAAGGGTRVWDFSIESVDRLQDIFLGLFHTRDEMRENADGPFIADAMWYLGEVQVRHAGASWNWQPEPVGEPGSEDYPFVMTPEEDADEDEYADSFGPDVEVPFSQLASLLTGEPGALLRDKLLSA
ncbi:hypothetical protein [Streptomyces sp. KR80]|uniref:hypothetical protein n=1 Tax=Streptomyces sp. KR80 TaxID=3457426 RepID=UPI003FD3F115